MELDSLNEALQELLDGIQVNLFDFFDKGVFHWEWKGQS